MLKKLSLNRIISLVVFIVAFAVYYFSAERTGSLWDCGEFILGAYKLQVVHPPGAPLFLIVGRLMAFLGDVFGSHPSTIAFAVNLMSSLFTAATAALIADVTMKLSGRFLPEDTEGLTAKILLSGAGLVAGLATAFASSIWFSAVEGEVYAMSTFFTALTFWAVIKWYFLPNDIKYDRWLVFAAYSAGLSVGVHLLSLLTFPALALFVYLKKTKSPKWKGMIIASAIGAIIIPLIQKLIITGIPSLWLFFDKLMVNSFGLPFNSGIIPTIAIIAALCVWGFSYARKKNSHVIELVVMSALMVVIGYSMIGVVVIRANADTPINMNVPSDPARILPYLNREQYGERSLLYGPAYDAKPISYDREDRVGRVSFPPYYEEDGKSSEYVKVNQKLTAKYAAKDKMLFPRISDGSQGRPRLYQRWYQYLHGGDAEPNMMFNIAFFFRYQINWMYMRYFFWNFVGRQNAEQGYYAWDKSDGNWESGIKFVDESKLYNMDEIPETMKNDKSRNHYYFLPLIFGLIGLFLHYAKNQKEWFALFVLFFITGLGIILYSNQPPNEPRERDYVLVGSFFTFCIWIGMAIPALYHLVADKFKVKGMPVAAGLAAIVLVAPVLMGVQNFDDHSRMGQYASRDYAKNFLNSLEENAIIFTYGDNDTYPLWYVQEVENVRPDVRIVNLSLIAVDWYINKLRRKINDSPPLKLTISPEAYRGDKRNQTPFYVPEGDRPMSLKNVLEFVGGNNKVRFGSMEFESYIPTHTMLIPTDRNAISKLDFFSPGDSVKIAPAIRISFGENRQWLTKDNLAILDVIASNIWERPIYFATTVSNSKMLGLNDYLQYEGLALRIVPVKTPSDRSLSIFGSGRVATDKVYDNIMNKFAWGNFDKEDFHINTSYGAAIQSHRMVMMRTSQTMISKGENQKALALTDKYFEVFPHMNFPYDSNVVPFIRNYVRLGQNEKAKEHLRILAQESADWLDFYNSIDPAILKSSFQNDYGSRIVAVRNILSLAQGIGEQDFLNEMQALVGQYNTSNNRING